MELSLSLDPASGKDFAQYLDFVNSIDGITIHCDVMDGSFVPRISIPRSEYAHLCKKSKHKIDVHLMVEKVEENLDYYLSQCCRGMIRSICFHVEAITYPQDRNRPEKSATPSPKAIELVEKIRMNGIEGGIAIDLDTDIDEIDERLLFMCDVITMMSVKAGASGQTFNKDVLAKVKKIKRLYPNVRIILDGGINLENIEQIKKAGVDTAVSASAVYNAEFRIAAIKTFKKLIQS